MKMSTYSFSSSEWPLSAVVAVASVEEFVTVEAATKSKKNYAFKMLKVKVAGFGRDTFSCSSTQPPFDI